jgi:hypothetical protein
MLRPARKRESVFHAPAIAPVRWGPRNPQRLTLARTLQRLKAQKHADLEVQMATATWKPHTEHGDISSKDEKKLPDSVFAFPKERKEPLTDASHVKNALARFDQVKGVSDDERDQAFANIKKAAEHYGIDVEESSWHDLGKKPHTSNPSH